MTEVDTIYGGGPIFDGLRLRTDTVVHFAKGRLIALTSSDHVSAAARYVDLEGDILSPGYLDLQVNGGDGLMLNEAPTVQGLRRIAAAHRRLGTVQILPTLITDTPAKTSRVIVAVTEALAEGVAGIAGLHLEGPHLSQARKGAHDEALIRPMTEDDLAELIAAAQVLPVLKITLAPETVTLAQVRALSQAGALLSLGHTEASYEQARDYAAAGVSCVTHLYNAMSQLGSRAPGLVGAALTLPDLNVGVIADGIHVHPASLRAAWAAKAPQQSSTGRLFLVSDAMAPAGTDISGFSLEGRQILRHEGRLTLADGTLAGADLDLTTAVRVLAESCDLPLEQALSAAVTTPRQIIGQWGQTPDPTGMGLQDFIRIRRDLTAARPLVELPF
ncbi:N-acetylglucosamine-6-phosphate deacetylase [Pseudophaeobacter sp.]|uniref:N-acetylglucosamine-6-phosphate deacetylase n=1 Tax=Pseudophaeobacter sp. TaxID=1971739 RepID=UPI004057CBF8